MTTEGGATTYSIGTVPTLLTAGHDGQQVPEGIALRQNWDDDPRFFTGNDVGTYGITQQLATTLEQQLGGSPWVVLFNFQRKYVDVNRPRFWAYDPPKVIAARAYTAYHSKIAQSVRRIRQGLLLDIHGTSLRDGNDIYLGTVFANSVANLWGVRALGGALAAAGYQVVLDHRRLSGGYTVKFHGAYWGGLDAIQIEIARHLRATAAQRDQLVTDLAAAITPVVRGYQELGSSSRRAGGEGAAADAVGATLAPVVPFDSYRCFRAS
jgi:N-formylglutamate amidohydrolase